MMELFQKPFHICMSFYRYFSSERKSLCEIRVTCLKMREYLLASEKPNSSATSLIALREAMSSIAEVSMRLLLIDCWTLSPNSCKKSRSWRSCSGGFRGSGFHPPSPSPRTRKPPRRVALLKSAFPERRAEQIADLRFKLCLDSNLDLTTKTDFPDRLQAFLFLKQTSSHHISI